MKYALALCLLVLNVPLAANAAIIQSTSVSSSDSGGIISGSAVSDDTEASAEIHTTLQNGNSHVEIRTVQNGVEHTVVKDIALPKNVMVKISTSTVQMGTSSFSGASTSSTQKIAHVLLDVHRMLRKLFSFFWWR